MNEYIRKREGERGEGRREGGREGKEEKSKIRNCSKPERAPHLVL